MRSRNCRLDIEIPANSPTRWSRRQQKAPLFAAFQDEMIFAEDLGQLAVILCGGNHHGCVLRPAHALKILRRSTFRS